MADLKAVEKRQLERFFEMGTGYVCNFYNRTFRDFLIDSIGIDVYDEDYFSGLGSKAVRLRYVWKNESNNIVAKLLDEMLDYWASEKTRMAASSSTEPFDEVLYADCKRIVERLRSSSPIENADAFIPNNSEKDFDALATSIRESIQRGQPEQALDRLHTFLMKYIKTICVRHDISFDKSTTLHALFGSYVRMLKERNFIESKMTQEILSSSIKVLDAFNKVRNDQSFAHDNPILNREESVLIFNNVANTVKFVGQVEAKVSEGLEDKNVKARGTDEPSPEEIEAAADAWIQLEADRMRGK